MEGGGVYDQAVMSSIFVFTVYNQLQLTTPRFFASLQVLDSWVFGRIFCDIWAAVDVLCCTASIMSLCAISIDRYIGVRYPLQYPMIVTEKRALLAMLGVWILAIVISIGPLLGWKQPPSQVRKKNPMLMRRSTNPHWRHKHFSFPETPEVKELLRLTVNRSMT